MFRMLEPDMFSSISGLSVLGSEYSRWVGHVTRAGVFVSSLLNAGLDGGWRRTETWHVDRKLGICQSSGQNSHPADTLRRMAFWWH